jgi:hypothetical protein
MSEQDGKPVRRLRAVRAAATPVPARETAESVLPNLPRVGALDALLREVDGLRLSLETDLTLAAAAVEGGAPQMAIEIIDNDLDGLRAFESRALDHLSDLAHPAQDQPASRRWWSHVPAAPFVAAAAVGFLLGVVPHTGGATPGQISASPASASQSLANLTRLAADGQTSQVRDAASTLHSQLMVLIDQAGSNPNAAKQGLLLLASERAVIAQSGDSQALRDVLAASNSLSNLILNALPAAVRTFAPTAPPVAVAVPSPTPSTRASSKPSAKPSSTPSPKPTSTSPNKPSTPTTSSPSPSPSSSGAPVLPSGPHVG